MSAAKENFKHEQVISQTFKSEEHLSTTEEALFILKAFENNLKSIGGKFIGYPCNRAFDLTDFFDWWKNSYLSQIPLNDVGNPEDNSSYGLNSRPFERELIANFASYYNLPIENAWGYTTTGGTLGNEQGLYLGRVHLQAFGEPILYVSEEAHYSIKSLAKILSIDLIVIESTANGEINYKKLEEKINPNRPALFSISIGTTFKGAIDDIKKIDAVVKAKKIEHFFYHADAALFGGHLAFLDDPNAPKIDFQNLPYHSIAVSGHKFFGSPVPLGFFLTKKEFLQPLQGDYIEYISSSNVTIPCSRSALNTLILWWVLKTKKRDFPKEAQTMLGNAFYLQKQLLRHGISAYLNRHSNTVYFKVPSPDLCRKWFLATVTCPFLGPLGHVVVMQHVTKELLDEFISDLIQDSYIRS
ncbi:Serine decarboxylase [Chlamydiales bacterium SCGC AB-751-O23]|jgi:histidine decarboxylase|nr:Serine decarboxylase [Chlamydiales bacterium SCGC AB-751-O23]